MLWQGFNERDDDDSDADSSGTDSQPAAYQAGATNDMTSDPTSMQLPPANQAQGSQTASNAPTSLHQSSDNPTVNRASINFISDFNLPDLAGSSDESSEDNRYLISSSFSNRYNIIDIKNQM